jgi:DNA-binding transcriptional ArsR family regulator
MLKPTLSPEMEDRVFAALADSTRRQLLITLAEHSPKTATQLAQEFPISRQGIMKHLDLLVDAGLVQTHTQGREKRFVVVLEPLQDVNSWIVAIGKKWEARLQQLKALVESDEDLD